MTDYERNWEAHAKDYRNDIVLFAEEQWIDRTAERPIVLMPHQKRFLRHVLTRDADGRFPYVTIIDSQVKKSGKTELAALVTLWVALTEPGLPECYVLANDLEQAQARSFAAIKQVIQRNPILRAECKVAQRRIILPSGGFIEALPSDYAGGAGANPTMTTWDELWAYRSESSMRLFEEFTPVPTRKNSIRWIATYAGFKGESTLLERLYERVVTRRNRIDDDLEWYHEPSSSTFAFWSHTPRMPWQTPEYYRQQKAELRPNAFLRLHRNKWVSPESAFISPDQWDALPTLPEPPRMPEGTALYIGIDAAHKRDCTAAVACAIGDGGNPILVDYRIWRPSRGKPILPESVIAPFLAELASRYRIAMIYYDPAHFESAGRLMPYRAREFTQTPANLAAASSALYDAIVFKRLTVFLCPDLREHVLNADAVEGPRGWKLLKRGEGQKVDGAIALAMALTAIQDVGAIPTYGIKFGGVEIGR